jgi:hypothetical protein
MAAGGVVSVTPVGPGQYRADFANGNSIPLMGKTGEDEYNRFLAQQSLSARGAVAGPGAGAPADEQSSALGTLGRAALLSNPITAGGLVAYEAGKRLLAPKTPEAPAERTGKTTVEEPKAQEKPSAAAEAPAAAAEALPDHPVSLGQTLEATDPATGKKFTGEAFRMPDGTVRVMRSGTAGSPGGLTALGKQTMAQYGHAMAASGEHSARAAEAQQIGVDIAVQDAEARQAFVQKQQELNLLEQHRQQDEERELQTKVAGLESKYELARQTFADARVDPTRIGKGGKNWLFGLSAALGAFGAGLARTPNFAMDFINARVADDIRAQEAEINVKGRDADNQLAGLTRSLGDLRLAKTAYKQLKLEEASLAGQRIAGQFKGQAIANNALMVSEQAAAEGIKVGEQRSREFVEHVMKEKLYYSQGSAGTRGGLYLTGTNELQGRKNLEADPASTDKELARAQARAELHPVESGRTEKISAFAAGIDSALKITSELEKRKVTEDVYDDPQSGLIDRASDMEGNADLRRETSRLASGYQAARGKSDKDAELAEQDATGSGSGRDRYHSAKSAVTTFARKAREELVTLPSNKQEELLAGMSAEARAAILGAK